MLWCIKNLSFTYINPAEKFGVKSSFPAHIEKTSLKHHFRLRPKNYR